MRCSLRCVVIYFGLISCTSFITTVIFYYVRRSPIVDQQYKRTYNVKPLLERHLQKRDWHDLESIQGENERTGLGEHGIAASLPDDHDEDQYKELFSVNGFNALLSDYISINRSVPDIRHADCKYMKYNNILPDVSIVIPFHNEHWSTLLRTIYSVLNRSPPQLLKEIILVDDASTKDHCKKQLDDYISVHFSKVKLIHFKKREGLIRARLAGAKIANGSVLIFLDSHTEANTNWLPPLLAPISSNYRICVCPFIDVIDFNTFEYRAQDEGARGSFDWKMDYKRLPLLDEDRENPIKPFKSPVMAGGLFAISKNFFYELGGYDPALDIWGGEQYELSFKIWQCGGLMLDAPCSRIGHIYRKFSPFPNPGVGNFVARNIKRVAEVWMDEYAEYVYKRHPDYRNVDVGDLDEQKKLRDNLKCKPFNWFMSKVAFDLVQKYPTVEPSDYGDGMIKPFNNLTMCLTADTNEKIVELKLCNVITHSSNQQSFTLTWHKDIRVKETNLCFDAAERERKEPIQLYNCHGDLGNQLFKYDMKTKRLLFRLEQTEPKCVTYNDHLVYIDYCDESNAESQKWSIQNLNIKAMKKWGETIPKIS